MERIPNWDIMHHLVPAYKFIMQYFIPNLFMVVMSDNWWFPFGQLLFDIWGATHWLYWFWRSILGPNCFAFGALLFDFWVTIVWLLVAADRAFGFPWSTIGPPLFDFCLLFIYLWLPLDLLLIPCYQTFEPLLIDAWVFRTLLLLPTPFRSLLLNFRVTLVRILDLADRLLVLC